MGEKRAEVQVCDATMMIKGTSADYQKIKQPPLSALVLRVKTDFNECI